MDEWWRLILALLILHQNISFCLSLKNEGLALLTFKERVSSDPFQALSDWKEKDGNFNYCSWSGIECSEGKVVCLHLKDLCLDGTLAPELGRLSSLKSIILRNNSLSGNIPKEIGELTELEVLDLGYNNFSGLVPSNFADNPSLTTLLLDNNKLLGGLPPELLDLEVVSEVQADENQLRASCNTRDVAWNSARSGGVVQRLLLQVSNPSKSSKTNQDEVQGNATPSPSPAALLSPFSSLSPSASLPESPSQSLSPSPSPTSDSTESPSPSFAEPTSSPHISPSPQVPNSVLRPPVSIAAPPLPKHFKKAPEAPAPTQNHINSDHTELVNHTKPVVNHIYLIAGIAGGSLLVMISTICIICFRRSKVVTVRPWTTGLSGQLQKAFVTGVPKLKRSELEAACEGFSNIIGSFPDGTVYKGTLSSGVEIAVTSIAVASRGNWSKNLESKFRKKIDVLSKVNHKNFVNLIGFCEDDEPFTRMLVFEYAPNGTLFEHLHMKESEHLDWGMRLRIAMGMSYCVEHLHQLNPPIVHQNLQSSSVFLTEDYAAKISDFSFPVDKTAKEQESIELLNIQSADLASNVYNFGVILEEMITGRIPYAVENGSPADWAADYLQRDQPSSEITDPTLKFFDKDVLVKLLDVIKDCTHSNPEERPTMREVTKKLKEITTMDPDGATPKLSPLWWAELEIMSSD